MKKIVVLIFSTLIISLSFWSCKSNINSDKPFLNKEKTIKISSKKPVEFSMILNGKLTENLKTPYEFKFSEDLGYFVFKPKDMNDFLEVDVTDSYGSVNSYYDGVSVLNIENGTMSVFGM